MTNLTANQAKAMTALIKACLSNMGGDSLSNLECDPFTWVDTSDLVDAGWNRKAAEGTFGSLVVSGHIYEPEHNMFALTEDWDELRNFHE